MSQHWKARSTLVLLEEMHIPNHPRQAIYAYVAVCERRIGLLAAFASAFQRKHWNA